MVARFKAPGTGRRLYRSIARYGWQPVWGAAANATPWHAHPGDVETIRDMIVGAAGRLASSTVFVSPHGAMVTATEDDRGGRAARGPARHRQPTCRSWRRSTCTPMPP